MISVPEACLLPRMPVSVASPISASVRSSGKQGIVLGKKPQSKLTGTPAISQCPDGVSLPLEISMPWPQRPVMSAAWAIRGSEPRESRAAAPSPNRARLGTASGPERSPGRSARPSAHAAAMWPKVSAPASPNRTASSAPPMPNESMTSRSPRFMGFAPQIVPNPP